MSTIGKPFASPIAMDPTRPHSIPPPDDALVRKCRDEAAAALDHWMRNGAQVEDAPDRVETVVALADEVLRLRAENSRLSDALSVSAEQVRVEMERRKAAELDGETRRYFVIRENNALRKNNRGLTKDLEVCRARVKQAESALQFTGAMAAYYKLQAQGGNYDATQEDCPGCAEQWNAALEEAARDAEAVAEAGGTPAARESAAALALSIRALKKP